MRHKTIKKLPVWAVMISASTTALTAQSNPDVDVTVIATRSSSPTLQTAGSDVAVTAADIERAGAISLGEALKYEPGISVPFDFSGESAFVPYLGGGDQSINIRGIEGNRIAVNIDGIRQPEDFVAQTFLGQGGPGRVYFDPAVLEQVEIFKSATSSLYGSDALGGTVDGRTVSPEGLLGDELLGYSVDNTVSYASVNESFNNRLAAGWGNGSLGTSLVYSYKDGSERINNGDQDPNPQDISSHAFVFKGVYKTDTVRIEGTIDYFEEDTFTDANAAEGAFFFGAIVNEVVTQDDTKERVRASVRADITPESGFVDSASVQVYRQESTFSTLNVQQGTLRFGPFPTPRDRRNAIDYRTEIAGIDVQAETLLAREDLTHMLRYGLEYSLSDVTSDFLRTDFAPDGSATFQDRIGMAPSEVERFGFFILDEISVGLEEKWVITPGLRIDSYDVRPTNTEAFLDRTVIPFTNQSVEAVDYDNIAWAPSLSVLYRFTSELNAYASYSRGIRNPTAEELNGVFTHGTDFIVVSNPDLDEETSDSSEIGLQGSYSEHSFQIAGFFNQYDGFLATNQLSIDNPEPEPDVLTTVNLGEVEIYGIEVSWDWRAGQNRGNFQGVEAGLSAAWSEGERTNIDQPLNTIDPMKAVGYIGYRSPDDRWGLRFTGTGIAEKEDDDIDQTSPAGALEGSESIFVADLTGFVRIGENIELRAGINNLFDEKYILWSTARRGAGHGAGEAGDRNTQPGVNGFVSVGVTF